LENRPRTQFSENLFLKDNDVGLLTYAV